MKPYIASDKITKRKIKKIEKKKVPKSESS